ncbi:tissue factor pathway inhibitor-like [Chiloscyllium plagiosum]|uniref:tissue factor pathway inhibitor-like n=1 Tax=Chiloscyllium plagiosum TaxID=36176 RepID=UPI001CB8840D|nr:tissue factor pathway inhibitor-like [Chiloscyllium plagiosum]
MLFNLLKVAVLLLSVDCEAAARNSENKRKELTYGHEICTYKADGGDCKAINKRYYFNIFTQKCEAFIYGGCGGNENNFETMKECLAKCKGKDRRNPCQLEADSGPCRGLFHRYFYNKTTKKCEQFIYGGCLGNKNKFRTEKDCLNACHRPKLLRSSDLPNFCMDTADKGDCNKSITKYFYNESIGNCQAFTYSGCGGNRNNFKTKQLCRKTCRKGTRRQ